MTPVLVPDTSTIEAKCGRWIVVNAAQITYMSATGLENWESADLHIEFGNRHSLHLQYGDAQEAWDALGFMLPPNAIRKPVEPLEPLPDFVPPL